MAVAPGRNVSLRILTPPETVTRGTRQQRGIGPATDLHAAVRKGDLAQARALLEDGGASPGSRGPGGVTPLMLCALHDGEARALACARMLLQAGARVGDSEPSGGWDAIMLAAALGRGRLLRLLLSAGEGGEVARRERSAGMTALHLAVWADRPREAGALAEAMRRQRLGPGEPRDALGRSAAALARELGRGECEGAIERAAAETPGPSGDRRDAEAGPRDSTDRRGQGTMDVGADKAEPGAGRRGDETASEARDGDRAGRHGDELEAGTRPGDAGGESEETSRAAELRVAPGARLSRRPSLPSGRWTVPRAGRPWRSLGQDPGFVVTVEGGRRRGATAPEGWQRLAPFAARRGPDSAAAATAAPGLPPSLRPLSAGAWERSERCHEAHARAAAFARRFGSPRSAVRHQGADAAAAAAKEEAGKGGWDAGERRRGAAAETTASPPLSSSSSYPTSSDGGSAGAAARDARPRTAPALTATALGARARPGSSWRDSLADLSVYWEPQFSPSYRVSAAGPAASVGSPGPPGPTGPTGAATRAPSDVSDAAGSSGGEGKGRLKGAARNRGRRAISRTQSRAALSRKEQ